MKTSKHTIHRKTCSGIVDHPFLKSSVKPHEPVHCRPGKPGESNSTQVEYLLAPFLLTTSLTCLGLPWTSWCQLVVIPAESVFQCLVGLMVSWMVKLIICILQDKDIWGRIFRYRYISSIYFFDTYIYHLYIFNIYIYTYKLVVLSYQIWSRCAMVLHWHTSNVYAILSWWSVKCCNA